MMRFVFSHLISLVLSSIGVLLLTSCKTHYLNVQTQYLSRENLASFHINSPDPCLEKPIIGQRLLIEWALPKNFCHYPNINMKLKVRFRNHKEEEISIPIQKRWGNYLYCVLEDQYFKTQGIVTYKVDLFTDNCLISSWKHPLWSELITFETCENQKT